MCIRMTNMYHFPAPAHAISFETSCGTAETIGTEVDLTSVTSTELIW